MDAVLTTAGRLDLDAAVRGWLNGLTLRLFVNDHTPAIGDAVASYTEAGFGGYAAVPLTAWGAAALDAAQNAEWDYAAQAWTAGGAGLPAVVYGYYVTNAAGAVVLAQRDDAPLNLTTAGQQYQVRPRFFLGALAGPY